MLAATRTATRRLVFTSCRYRPSPPPPLPLRPLSTLPYHHVIGMPALSPTMESGTIASWNVAEGDAFIAGDALAEIETDKATMAFEAQDDGFVAKILTEAGSGKELMVGEAIMVTVEEEEDIGAFKDFVPEVVAAVVEEEEVVPVVAAAAPAPVVEVVSPPPPVATPTPPPPEAAAAPVPDPVAVAMEESVAVSVAGAPSPQWGDMVRESSPLVASLGASQKAYIELYGSTGQVPL